MTREEVIAILVDKIVGGKWHYLKYHFSAYKNDAEHFLCASIVNACLTIESKIPGYVDSFANKLAAISGRENHLPHYEQIIQLLAELFVIKHLASVELTGARYIHEPRAHGSAKNPEVGIVTSDKQIYVEVKCRDYVKHHNDRGAAAIAIPGRMDGIRELASTLLKGNEKIVYPRDNVLKDFLESANEKFRGFKAEAPDVITLLVIIWDDFIYEPITALLNEHSGLLTEKSFFLDAKGRTAKFENIDAIVLASQSHHIVAATRAKVGWDGLVDPLDWGSIGLVKPKAYIPINASEATNNFLCKIMQSQHIAELGDSAEYRPQELILQFGLREEIRS